MATVVAASVKARGSRVGLRGLLIGYCNSWAPTVPTCFARNFHGDSFYDHCIVLPLIYFRDPASSRRGKLSISRL
jgi:hypothetical protein